MLSDAMKYEQIGSRAPMILGQTFRYMVLLHSGQLCHLEADRLEDRDGFLSLYRGPDRVAMFNKSLVAGVIDPLTAAGRKRQEEEAERQRRDAIARLEGRRQDRLG